MEDERKPLKLNRDYRILSSYLNRWATVIVFSVIIALAVGALSIKSDDMAHMSVVIGVSALDSARAGPALQSFADFCRGKGCGDIRWRYLRSDGASEGCDFYITTSLSLSASLAKGTLGCALIAADREAHRYSRSAVIVRAGVRSLPASGARVIFSSTRSASGFLAPYRSLERAGYTLSRATIDFTGPRPREDRVVFGVLYGAYDAGGISLERLQALERTGVIRRGELDVLFEGEAFPEIVLAFDPSSCSPDRKSFVTRLPGVFDRAPRSLRRELAAIGIAGFYTPRPDDLELIKKLHTMIPAGFALVGEGGVAARL
ncbi:MAG TPA: PhnD/SsuA/transferrin family substrate-binding protein [Candidatus Bathyarchaeia archaeon]|nr:PhnD/SsuA/transferrin family substrate-binding protein [Candidatus Bathyarchaeia archaeon]